jgi:uncharacterized protein
MGILERISDIEKEIARTQKNKGKRMSLTGVHAVKCSTELLTSFLATEYHLGLLKAKLAKYRQQLLEGVGGKKEKVRR